MALSSVSYPEGRIVAYGVYSARFSVCSLISQVQVKPDSRPAVAPDAWVLPSGRLSGRTPSLTTYRNKVPLGGSAPSPARKSEGTLEEKENASFIFPSDFKRQKDFEFYYGELLRDQWLFARIYAFV